MYLMEKYIVFIILVVLAYYLHNCWVENKINNILKTKEGFVDTINTSDPDLVKSITTLGQVCKDLQGQNGLTVPGKITCGGDVNITGLLTVNKINILKVLKEVGDKLDKYAKKC